MNILHRLIVVRVQQSSETIRHNVCRHIVLNIFIRLG